MLRVTLSHTTTATDKTHIIAHFFPPIYSSVCLNSRQWWWWGGGTRKIAGVLIGWVSPPLRSTEKRRRENAPTSMNNLQMFRSLFTRLGAPGVQTLTFSVSRSFTVGNGVLVDILCVSQAARRCSRLGKEAGQTRRGPSGQSGAAVPSLHPLETTPRTAALHHSIARTHARFV